MPNLIPLVIGSATALSLAVIGMQQREGAPPPTTAAVAVSLGFSPQSCAIAGLSAAESSDGLARLASATTLRRQYTDATAALDAAMGRVTLARDVLQQGLLSPQTRLDLAHAETALAAARADYTDARDVLRALLTGNCSDNQLERLHNCTASAGYVVPAEYRVLGYSPEGWEEVASAYRQQRRINAGVLDAADADLSAVAALDRNTEVAEAESRLEATFVDLRQTFGGFEG